MNTALAYFGIFLALSIGLWMGHHVLFALWTGTAEAAGGRQYKRKKSPLMYLLAVFVQSVFSLGFFYFALVRIAKL